MHPLEWLQKITSVDEDVEKRELLRTLGWNVNGAAAMENSMEVPKNLTQNYRILLSTYAKGLKARFQRAICHSRSQHHIHSSQEGAATQVPVHR